MAATGDTGHSRADRDFDGEVAFLTRALKSPTMRAGPCQSRPGRALTRYFASGLTLHEFS